MTVDGFFAEDSYNILVRTFTDWNNPAPGFFEADLVAHSEERMAGSFAHTLVLADIASG
jgi:hypothetical protein